MDGMDRFSMEEFMHSFEDDWQRQDRGPVLSANSGTMSASVPGDSAFPLSMVHGPMQAPTKQESAGALDEMDLFDLLEPMVPDPAAADTVDRSTAVRGSVPDLPLQHQQLPRQSFQSGLEPPLGEPQVFDYGPPNIRVDPIINVVEPEESPETAQSYVDEAFPMYSASGVPLKGGQVPMFQRVKEEFNSHDSSPSTSPHISVQQTYGPQVMPASTSPHMSPLMTTEQFPPGTPHSSGSPLESPLASPLIGSPLSGFDGSNGSSVHSFSKGPTSPMVEEPLAFDGFHTLDVPLRHSRALSDTWGDRERTAFLDTLAAQTQNRDSAVEFPKIQVHQHSPKLGQPTQLSVPQTRHRSHSSPYEPTNDLKGGQMFACELCDKRFTRAYNLRSHMRTHTDERPFACKHCGKAFARQHDRKRHEALHSGEKRFVCSGEYSDMVWGCKKRFARADALGRHFRTEAGKACLRPLIDRIFTNGSRKESAPEGILFTGVVDGEPQVALSGSRDSSQKNEREDHTRRAVIVTAVAEQLQGILMNGPSQLPSDNSIPSGA